MTDLRDLVDIVRISRNYTEGALPFPDGKSCNDYALTEAGEYIKALRNDYIDDAIVRGTEYIDAVLRAERSSDKRNNKKDHTPRSEWGQCGYMIASAIIQSGSDFCDDWHAWRRPDDVSVYSIITVLCNVATHSTGVDYPEVDAFDDWHAFCVKYGWSPADLLRETCAAFEVKHTGRAFTVVDALTQADVDEINKAFAYPVLTAEQAAAQGEKI